MARIRTIKPEFFTSLTVASLPVEARLTFIGLWTQVDDEGRCVDDARLVKAAVWPLDDRIAADVEADLRALDESSLITRYVVGERSYLAITNWREHQKIDRATKSKLPPPPVEHPEPPKGRRAAETDADPAANVQPEPPQPAPAPILDETSTSTQRAVVDTSIHDQGSGSGNREQGKDHHQRACAHEDTVRLIATLTGADDDDSRSVLDKILTRHRPANPGGYARTMHKSGDLEPLLAEVRRDRHDANVSAQRRAALAARLAAEENTESHATPEEAVAAKAQIRAFLAGGGPRPVANGEPSSLGAVLGARSA